MLLNFLPSFVQNVSGHLITHHANQLPTSLLKILRIYSLKKRKLKSFLGSQIWGLIFIKQGWKTWFVFFKDCKNEVTIENGWSIYLWIFGLCCQEEVWISYKITRSTIFKEYHVIEAWFQIIQDWYLTRLKSLSASKTTRRLTKLTWARR